MKKERLPVPLRTSRARHRYGIGRRSFRSYSPVWSTVKLVLRGQSFPKLRNRSHRQYSTSFGQLERSFSQRKSRMISAWLRSNNSPPVLANPRHPTTPRDRAQQVESQQRMGPLILQSPNRSRMETRRPMANKIRLLVSHLGSHGSTRTKSWPVSRPPSLF